MVFPADARPLIPQKEPFVMVDDLIFADNVIAKSRFIITAENPFCIKGSFQEGGLLENIAQTAAAHSGFNNLNSNEGIKKGFIGSVTNFEVVQLPVTGDLLTTEISITDHVFDVTVIKGMVYCNGEKVASAEMKIFISE